MLVSLALAAKVTTRSAVASRPRTIFLLKSAPPVSSESMALNDRWISPSWAVATLWQLVKVTLSVAELGGSLRV
jgi:hypothetical protein